MGNAQGTVDWLYQKQDAERVVRRLLGVKGVTNTITVKSAVVPSEIKQRIQQALVRSAQTDAGRITVQVDGSKVILNGTVRSRTEKQEAERRVAWAAPGVTGDNRIIVSWM